MIKYTFLKCHGKGLFKNVHFIIFWTSFFFAIFLFYNWILQKKSIFFSNLQIIFSDSKSRAYKLSNDLTFVIYVGMDRFQFYRFIMKTTTKKLKMKRSFQRIVNYDPLLTIFNDGPHTCFLRHFVSLFFSRTSASFSLSLTYLVFTQKMLNTEKSLRNIKESFLPLKPNIQFNIVEPCAF